MNPEKITVKSFNTIYQYLFKYNNTIINKNFISYNTVPIL